MANTADGLVFRGSRPRASRFLLFLVAATLVASTCGAPGPTSPRPSAGPSSAPAPSGSPTASDAPASEASPGPTPATTGWTKVTLAKYEPLASLVPTKGGAAGAALDTAFRLRSLGGTSATTLATRLEVKPDLQLRRGTARGDTIVLRPAGRLRAGTSYRFTIRRPDGTVAQAWTIAAAKTLQVVGTLPADATTGVPRDTGIEITFDQPGVTAAAVRDAFAIRPKVSGRFEVHGSTVVFVPAKNLKALTLYTVTLKKGLPLPGTGQTLKSAVTFQFETRRTGSDPDQLVFPSAMVDTATKGAPSVALAFEDWNGDDRVTVPSKLSIKVHRFADIDAAIAAHRRLDAAPAWARSGHAPIDTAGLTLTLKAKVVVQKTTSDEGSRVWFTLPKQLPAGWYIVTTSYGGRPYQVMVQVTNLAAYAMVTTTRTVVWVNSLASGRAVKGAQVSLAGTSLGRTDGDGLRIATTPASAKVVANDLRPVYLVVRDSKDRAVFLRISRQGMCWKCDGVSQAAAWAADAWWHVLATDRNTFRPTDRVNAWGIVRARDDGSLPKKIEVRVQTAADQPDASTPIVVAHPTPSSTGMFRASLAFADLPTGNYNVVLTADGVELGSEWIQVGSIVKPAWRMDVTTDKRAVLTGASVNATIRASFFEGTPVAGVDLRVGSDQEEDDSQPWITARTGADGVATTPVTVRLSNEDYDDSQWSWRDVAAAPTLPEEASIGAGTSVAVFRSTAILDAASVLDGKRLTVTGKLSNVDFARMQSADPFDWGVDPAGAPRAGATVKLTFTELVPTRTRVGTTYDFIAKRTVPVYEYDQREVDLGSRSVTTTADGTFRSTRDVTGGTHSYRVTARYVDEKGRAITYRTYSEAASTLDGAEGPSLMSPDRAPAGENPQYSVGDRVRVVMRGGHPIPADDRYLFTVQHRGLQRATIQSGPAYAVTFREAWVPNANITAVRFNGATYDVADYGYQASFRAEDRRLRVTLTPDAARYAPGGTVHVSVRTTDPGGHPVAATAVVRVIDKKLYEMGIASDVDVLSTLYSSVSDGVVATAWSHRATSDEGGGDTGGGGGDERFDFRDWLYFDVVKTDATGQASLSFDLSDDLTAWRMSAGAVDRSLRAGNAVVDIPVGLPFFAEAALAPEYLVGDQATLRVRGYGSALTSGDQVSFEVSAPSLGLAPTTTTAPAFSAASIALPALTEGDHQIRIVATTGTGTARHQDVLVRKVHVVATRAGQGRTASGPLTAGFHLQGGTTGFTTVVLADGGRGRVIPILLSVADTSTGRADQFLAAAIARQVLADTFAMPTDTLAADDVDLASFQTPDGGVALVPYASADAELSSLAALAGDPRVNATTLEQYLRDVAEGSKPTTTRHLAALAGLAALDQPVLGEIRRTAADTTLSATKRTWLALGAFAGGDEALAAQLERSILAKNGEQQGPWVRLALNSAETSITTTALLAIVASGLGDPLAAGMDAYVEAYPPSDTLVDLQRALAARLWAERTPGAPATLSMTVDGSTRKIAVQPDAPTWLTLTPAQLASASLTPGTGQVIVTSDWEGPLDPTSLHRDGITTFKREVTPSGPVPIDGVVTVRYTVELNADADAGCWLVTDLVPSGLAPIGVGTNGWFGEDEEEASAAQDETPWQVDGQRVDFCVERDPKRPVVTLRYIARVVSPGTYRWEPAVIQSSIVREHGAVVPAATTVITDAR